MAENKKFDSTVPGLRRLVGGSALIFTARITGAGLTFLTQILLARWMGAAIFGNYIFAFSVATVAGTATCLGLQSAAPRIVGPARADNHNSVVVGYLTRSPLVILLVSFSFSILFTAAYVLTAVQIEETILIAMAAVPLIAIARFTNGYSVALRWFGLAFVPNQILRPATFILLVTLLYFGGTRISPKLSMLLQVVAFGITLIVSSCLLLYRTRALRGATKAVPFQRSWLRISLPLLAVSIIVDFFPELCVMVFNAFLDPADVAVTSVALRLLLIVMLAVNAVDIFIASDIAELSARRDKNALQVITKRAAAVRFIIALSGFTVFAAFGENILAIFGPDFVAGREFLLVIMLGYLAVSLLGPCTQLLSLSGHQDQCVQGAALSLGILVMGSALLIPNWGLNGASITVVTTQSIWQIFQYVKVRQLLSIRPDIFS